MDKSTSHVTFSCGLHDPGAGRIPSELLNKYVVVSRQHEGYGNEVCGEEIQWLRGRSETGRNKTEDCVCVWVVGCGGRVMGKVRQHITIMIYGRDKRRIM